MADLDVPGNEGELYHSLGDDVSLGRPLFQGDILNGIIMPGLSDEAGLVMIISHPCSMRAGAALKPYVTVAAVKPRKNAIPARKWANSHYSVLPLPELGESIASTDFFYVDFNLVASIRSETIDLKARIACLSEYGVQLLQQRHVFHLTRVRVDLSIIRQQLAPTFAEVELGQDWIEAAVDVDVDSVTLLDQLAAAEQDFDAFLKLEDRRSRLRDETRRSGVRTEVRREIRRKFED